MHITIHAAHDAFLYKSQEIPKTMNAANNDISTSSSSTRTKITEERMKKEKSSSCTGINELYRLLVLLM